MDFNIEVRKKQLDNLDQVISSSKDRIQSVLNYLGWSAESVEKEDNLVQCPINPHHKISAKSWNEHIEKCLVRAEGYDVKSQFLSEPPNTTPAQCIYIDRNKKIEIITKELSERGALRLAWNGLDPDPRTSDRLITTFSQDERLLFYNYAVENTAGPEAPSEFTTIPIKSSEEKPPTHEELLAQERDSKRRRAKYKSVHLNRKNHTEVIREVINGQMEEYKEWLVTNESPSKSKIIDDTIRVNGEKKEEIERPHSSISRNSNSSSSKSAHRKNEYNRDRSDSSKDRHMSRRDVKDKNSIRQGDRTRSREKRRYSRDRERRHSSRDAKHKRH